MTQVFLVISAVYWWYRTAPSVVLIGTWNDIIMSFICTGLDTAGSAYNKDNVQSIFHYATNKFGCCFCGVYTTANGPSTILASGTIDSYSTRGTVCGVSEFGDLGVGGGDTITNHDHTTDAGALFAVLMKLH